MTRQYIMIAALVGLILAAALVRAELKDVSGVETLTSLVGEWQGNGPEGEPVRVSYQLTSGGATLMETFAHANKPAMVTMYYLAGKDLMLTHYCSLRNQPRMRATLPAGQATQLTFSFVDATNLASPSEAHMHRVAFTFQDADHFTQEWTLSKEGKELPHRFTLERTR